MVSWRNLIDKIFKDKHGRLAITSVPNPPLIIWAVATVAGKLFKHGAVHQTFTVIGFAAIVFWALLEIFHGVNYFRRVLGLVVLAAAIYSRF
jgi:hypothetical protein